MDGYNEMILCKIQLNSNINISIILNKTNNIIIYQLFIK